MKIFVVVAPLLVTVACRFDPNGSADREDAGHEDARFTDAPSPNCSGLAATCGSDGTDDCCSIATPIPGGTFYRDYDVAADGLYADKSYPATISPFVLDKYVVTVGRFRAFVAAGEGTQASPPETEAGGRMLNGLAAQGGWDPSWDSNLVGNSTALIAAVQCYATQQTWTDAAGANESLPINCVTWYEAQAFCIWDGGYLPTEAEWDFAAAGGAEQRAYPWSSPPGSTTIDCAYTNYSADPPNTYCSSAPGGFANRVGSESPQGDGLWGHADLEGNMFEWALDWYVDPYPTTTCDDCANLTPTSLRAIRGGGFNTDASVLRTSRRLVLDPPTTRFINVGFRCARHV